MDRLTREEIERKRDSLAAAVALVEGMSQQWMEERWKAANDLCDLALQSLSQEAVRDEADVGLFAAGRMLGFTMGLEAAKKVCEECRVLILGDPAAKQGAVMIARETGRDLARQIEALKPEPNAAAQAPLPARLGSDAKVDSRQVESATDASAYPAPAAPDVVHDWIERADDHGVYDCANCTSWTANLPLYKDEVCEAKERRFTDRRKGRSLR